MEATATCQCERCGLLCRVGGPKNPDARILRRSLTPKGYCASCAATQFLKTTLPLCEILNARGPEILRAPHVQAQFAAVLKTGGADATPEEVDWDRVIEHWNLPVAGEKRARREMGLEL